MDRRAFLGMQPRGRAAEPPSLCALRERLQVREIPALLAVEELGGGRAYRDEPQVDVHSVAGPDHVAQ